MKLSEFYALAASNWDGELVVCSASSAGHEWFRTTNSLDESLYIHSSMGLSSMVALGLALALPQANVWNFDGDGALAMNLGCLLVEAEQSPPNLTHFVIVNRKYAATSELPYANSEHMDFAATALGCGIPSWTATTLQEARGLWDDAVGVGYSFVAVEVESEEPVRPDFPLQMKEMKYRFARSMEQRFGVQVFGTEKY